MNNSEISIIELAKKLNLYVKIVVSIKSFNNFNSYFQSFSEYDEACRRVVVLTPYEELEEVNDENPQCDVDSNRLIDGNVWIKDFHLTVNPKKIVLEDIKISKVLEKQITKLFK